MAPANIGKTVQPKSRSAWRRWLERNHARAAEIWLVCFKKKSGKKTVTHDAAVEEALCFGWIDGVIKKLDAERYTQRFSPRRPRSNWSELNKERARRLIQSGKMTAAGRAVLPDLSLNTYQFPEDILARLRADPIAWRHFQKFPAAYKRIRIGFLENSRERPEFFEKRFAFFLKKTRENKMYGTKM
jgi:uncharacterized protein YdeI (YjbR/CyaY-like superfamily)